MRCLQSVMLGLVLACLATLSAWAGVGEGAANPKEQYKGLVQKSQQLNGKLSGARRQVLKENQEVAELRKKSEEAKKAYDEAMREQLMKNPEAAPIVKELDDVQQQLSDLREQMKKRPPKKQGRPGNQGKQ